MENKNDTFESGKNDLFLFIWKKRKIIIVLTLLVAIITTIVTFLMVFLIQKTQNKDSKAIHLKLNELLASHAGASNRMVDIEDLTEEELDRLHKFYVQLSDLAEQEDDILCTHSIDAAEENHNLKLTGHMSKKHYIDAKASRNKSTKGK